MTDLADLADPAALRDLVIANRILAREGVLDAFGHVSIRHPDEGGHYIISRSRGPELVLEADLQRYTLDGTQVGGNPEPGYAERAIHGAIYEARADVLAICHNHAPSIIPFGVTGVPLRPIYHVAGLIGYEIPLWDIADDFGDTDLLVRTMDQGRSLARALGDRRVALMRGHGSVVVGANVRDVVLASVYLEKNAQLQAQAIALGQGKVRYLSEFEVEHTGDMLRSQLVSQRVWQTLRQRVEADLPPQG